jgi:hypothetical protein
MLHFIPNGHGIVPEPIFEKFKVLILENYNQYQNQSVIDERIDTEEILYRLKFEAFIDPVFILIDVLEYKEFKKNQIKWQSSV